MVRIAIEQLQRNLTDALRRVEEGETVLVLRDNTPIAEIKPATDLRPAGLYKGLLAVPEDIAEPLPPGVLKDFEAT